MKKLCLALSVAALLCSFAPMASAFSRDENTNQNSDGSTKFADPDEQMPAFMVAPPEGTSASQSLLPSSENVTPLTLEDSDDGARAFNQAIAHQQSKD